MSAMFDEESMDSEWQGLPIEFRMRDLLVLVFFKRTPHLTLTPRYAELCLELGSKVLAHAVATNDLVTDEALVVTLDTDDLIPLTVSAQRANWDQSWMAETLLYYFPVFDYWPIQWCQMVEDITAKGDEEWVDTDSYTKLIGMQAVLGSMIADQIYARHMASLHERLGMVFGVGDFAL